MSFEINSIGLFHCRASSPPETDKIQIIDRDDLDDYSTVQSVTRDLIGKLRGKDFVTRKSARVHEFTEDASEPRDTDANTTMELLSRIIEREGDIASDLERLASWYLQTDYAQSGLLIISHITAAGRPQLAIIKAPFMDDAYEPDDKKVLTEMDQVIKGDLKKGILYPRITPSGDVIHDQACVYQAQSSRRYPKHWFEYLHLDPSQTSDERLSEEFDSDDESHPLMSPTSTEEFDEIDDQLPDNLKNANVTVEIAGMDVKVELGELLDRDNVHIIREEGSYHLVISGERPRIKFYDGNEGRYRELLGNLDSYDTFEELGI